MRTGSSIGSKPAIPCGTTRSTEKELYLLPEYKIHSVLVENPKPLLPYLPILKERGIGCYIQFTLNDYEEDGLETGVPPLTERIETFRTLSEILGKEAVIWRFDPLILTDNISVDTLIEKIERVGTEIHNCTEKLVFSFADIDSYRKVKANMTDSGIPYHEWNKEKMEELAGKLTVLNRNRGWNLELATCGENLDFGKYRISRNRCIDGDLIARLAWKDKELMSALGVTIQEMPSPAFFDMNDLPYGAVLLPGNKYFVSNHKRIRDNVPHADVWQPRILGNTILALISANTAMQIQAKKRQS